MGTLLVLLILGGVIVEIALAGILAVTFLNSQNYGVRLSAQALAGAQSGYEEAFLRIIRYKTLGGIPSGWNQFSFTPQELGGASVDVTICNYVTAADPVVVISGSLSCAQGTDQASGGTYEVVSRGSAFNKHRQLKARIAVDALTGAATLQSLKEVPYGN